MVSQLLSPVEPKNISDAIVLAVLGSLVLLLYFLPKSFKVSIFAVIFLFWRTCYNAGIGYLLYQQSNYNTLVRWAKQSKLYEDPSTGNNPNPTLFKILKREMETKIPKDYVFEKAPIEYNTWLTFRRVVDLILMCDFVSYCSFAIACGGRPVGESNATTIGRWAAGIALVLFNLWVKLDAHRVVKDFAWYWGDFFYLIDQQLTFDGVFEMAPHPMYSVGYAGFYGISLMAGSYKVLAISIIAHAAQFAFLTIVENPHIEKTYNPPPPRKRQPEHSPSLSEDLIDPRDLGSLDSLSPTLQPVKTTPTEPPATKDLLGIQNIDLHRVTDVAAILIQVYFYTVAILTPTTLPFQAFFVINAVIWRLWYSIGIGYLLDRQSKKKRWTRHFIKYGETTEEAWRQWKGIYHISMTMCYVSFVTAAFKMYHLPVDWSYGMVTLRHVIGAGLISLQIWTVFSIYESLGEFGWFFGDFFFASGPKLTYSGIYRFLNQPERILGLAGVWGAATITWSKSIFFLAFLSHLLTLCFIQFVERPHMQKRYGQSLRSDSGVSRSLKRSLPAPFRQWHGYADRMIDDTADLVDDFIEATGPHLYASIDQFTKDTKAFFMRSTAQASFTRVAEDLDGFNLSDYSITFDGTPASAFSSAFTEKASGREGEQAQYSKFVGAEFQPRLLEYGAPITVNWTAPLHHSKKDWIGLYMLADNSSPKVTRIASQGRWIATSKGVFDARAEQGCLVSDKREIKWQAEKGQPLMTGTMEFSSDKLWWTTGVFEFRYHHDSKHNVMARSEPFEIRLGKLDDDADPDPAGAAGPVTRQKVEAALLPIVQNCFDRDPEIAPGNVDEAFGSLVEREGKFARRVVFALRQMVCKTFPFSVLRPPSPSPSCFSFSSPSHLVFIFLFSY